MSDDLRVESELQPVDRSTLENYANCPAMGRFIETGSVLTATNATESGNAAHAALSAGVREWIDSRGQIGVTDLREMVLQAAAASNPDVQPDAIRAVKFTVWQWAKFITGIHPGNILRFDGGSADLSGQIAADMVDLGLRITSEVDLLYAGPSKSLIHEIDYKSGRKHWTAAAVADSFQFALHAWLLLQLYPSVDAIEIRVWCTRSNSLTYGVEWPRSEIYNLGHRVRSAAVAYKRWQNVAPDQCEAWPTIEKCGFCPAASICPAPGRAIRDPARDPETMVDCLVAMEAQADAIRTQLGAIVDQTGEDITTQNGNAFGVRKPSNRKPTKSLYIA